MAYFRGNVMDDPFFGDVRRLMHYPMRDLDSLLNGPFGMMTGGWEGENGHGRTPRQQMIEDGRIFENRPARTAENDSMALYGHPMAPFMESFGFGSGLFGGIMRQMEQLQSQAIHDPSSHIYTQSTVVTFAPGEDGRPKIYEATESMRKAGDVKETRRSVRDPDRGVEKMEIGHHIGNRGHVIEKRRDRATGGQIIENQQFFGLREDDAERFDQEWSRATRQALSGEPYVLDDSGPLAVEGAKRRRSQSVPRHQQERQSGPIIQEITEEDSSRNRGGFFGRVKSLFRA